METAEKLQRLTKAELIWVILELERRSLGMSDLPFILRDLEFRKLNKREQEADRLLNIAAEKRMAYCELMKPYEGKRLGDIPQETIEKASRLLEEAEEAGRKWDRMIGIAERERRKWKDKNG
ncbi:MAG: hypothetical protein PUH34_12420 [Eubacteriales bacterium]|nr:hypothetical protein [Eubacteriales bacterium]